MKGPVQRSLHCPCGNEKILALGLCSTCHTLKRQDEEYFGGHREEVLARDGYRCRIPNCATVKRGKRSVAVLHRKPGNSDPKLMITLCLPCHAKVSRTQREQRHVSQQLSLAYDRRQIILERGEVADKLAGQYVEVYDFSDRPLRPGKAIHLRAPS